MIKRLMASIGEFKKPSIITLILMVGEVVIEVLIPFITANLVNMIKASTSIDVVIKQGVLLVIMAFLSLTCGGLAAFTAAKASSGFARNLRCDMFNAIQSYSFENVDKFSSASLVTRMTTDVANVQMSYQMLKLEFHPSQMP